MTFYMTRREYIAKTGLTPHDDVIGVTVLAPDCKTIVDEYIFTDEEPRIPMSSMQVEELERMFKI